VNNLFSFFAFNSVFVHTKYTTNMVACYDNDSNKVTASRLLEHPVTSVENIAGAALSAIAFQVPKKTLRTPSQ